MPAALEAQVATELFFDLNALDLTQVVVTTEEVESLNPQRGGMRQIDHVIWFSDDDTEGVGVKHVTDDEFWVPLHIPGRPMMPGVLMIEAAAQLASLQFRRRGGSNKFVGFTRCDETIFRGIVVPGDTLYILGREIRYNRRRLIVAAQGVVDGLVVFETKITGMVL
jgi:3-hydroxyacyl-[acyl-carrier-protein] dehydratase